MTNQKMIASILTDDKIRDTYLNQVQKTKTIKVYALVDANGNYFYIGCTRRKIEDRVRSHISEAKNWFGGKIKNEKLRQLNFNFSAVILEEMEMSAVFSWEFLEKAKELEAKWINRYRALNYELCNVYPLSKTPAP